MVAILDFLTLQNKHNIHCTYIVCKNKIYMHSLQNRPDKLVYSTLFYLFLNFIVTLLYMSNS